MKKIFIIILLTIFVKFSFAQNGDIRGRRIIANEQIILRDYRVDTIANDTTRWNIGFRKLPTAKAVYDFVNNRTIGGGGGGTFDTTTIYYNLAQKLNITDTVGMLLVYKHWLQGYLKYADSATIRSLFTATYPLQKLNGLFSIDTSIGKWRSENYYNTKYQLIGNYLLPNDTVSLSDRINTKWDVNGNITGGTKKIGPTDAQDLQIITNNTPRITVNSGGDVGIGTPTPASSALLDVSSTTKGFLPPRVTTAQMNAIPAPIAGLMVYNTDSIGYCKYTGTAWRRLLESFHLNNITFPSGVRRHTLRTNGVGTSLFLDSALQINFHTYRNLDSSTAYMRLPSASSNRVSIGYAHTSTNVAAAFYIQPVFPSANIGFSINGTGYSGISGSSDGFINIASSGRLDLGFPDTGYYAGTPATPSTKNGIFISKLPRYDSNLVNKLNVVWDSISKQLVVVSSIVAPTDYVPTSRTLTINGVPYDLTADRSWTISPGAADSTFYTSNGTVTYARRINANGFPITIDSAALFRIRDTAITNTGATHGHIYDFNKSIDFVDYDSVLTVGYKQNSLSGIEMYVKDRNNFDTSNFFKINADGISLKGVPHSNTITDKMLVWDSIDNKLRTRLLPTGSSQNLQSVTDIGNSTTNEIVHDAGSSKYAKFTNDAGEPTMEIYAPGTPNNRLVFLQANRLAFGTSANLKTIVPGTIAGNYTYTLPNATGTFALTSDIPASGITVGTTTITSGTSGAIAFNNAGTYGEKPAKLFWKNSDDRLGVGTATPGATLHANGTFYVGASTPSIYLEGTTHTAEIEASNSATPLTLIGGSRVLEFWNTKAVTKAGMLGLGTNGAPSDNLQFSTYNTSKNWVVDAEVDNVTGNFIIRNKLRIGSSSNPTHALDVVGNIKYSGFLIKGVNTFTSSFEPVSSESIIDPSSVAAVIDVQLPVIADGTVINLHFGGQIAVGSPVATSLTWSFPIGTTAYGSLPTSANGGDIISLIKVGSQYRRINL